MTAAAVYQRFNTASVQPPVGVDESQLGETFLVVATKFTDLKKGLSLVDVFVNLYEVGT